MSGSKFYEISNGFSIDNKEFHVFYTGGSLESGKIYSAKIKQSTAKRGGAYHAETRD